MFLDVFCHRLVRTIYMIIFDILCYSHNYVLGCGIGEDIFELSIGDNLLSWLFHESDSATAL
jgi:hypothetical protein